MKAYDFNTFKDFFEFHIQKNLVDENGQKKTTLNDLAKKLGYNSASSLSMIASGERLPSSHLLESLFDAWKLSAAEKQRIRLKVEIEKRKRKGKESAHLISQFNKLAPYKKIDLKNFNVVNDWYVMVIKVLASTPDFSEDPQVISQKLRKKVSAAQVKKALALLEETRLLIRDSETGKLKPSMDRTETTHEIISEAIRQNHKSMMKRAVESVEEQTVEQRQLNSLSFQFNPKSLPKAKAKILNFIKEFNEEFNSDQSNQVYQLNVQLFEHTNGGNKNDH